LKPTVASPVRLSASRRLLIVCVGAGLWLSGGLWLIFHYFLAGHGEWGREPHALEPWWLKLHGAFAFLALWTFGLLWGAHIVGAWRSGRRRVTGGLLFAVLTLLILTGYLRYYAGDDGLWGLTSPTHWIIGLALPVGYGLHRLFDLVWARRRK
jgi:hypothetical protein